MIRVGLQITSNTEKYAQLLAILNRDQSFGSDVDFIRIPDEDVLKSELPNLDVLVCYRLSPESFKYIGSRLKWIHFGAAGIEHSLFPELIRSSITITNAKGIHGGPVSEFVFASLLHFAKRFDDCRTFKSNREWRQWDIAEQMTQLKGKQLGVIGYGAIGKAILEKAKAFDMITWAVRRSKPTAGKSKLANHLIPVSEMNEMLGVCDFVVISCPLTPQTKGLLGTAEFILMKPNAVLVNIARGAIANESALINALRNNEIAGAALDVFHQEPLNKNSPLFDLDNVFLSPHISGNFPEYQGDVMIQFGENLERWLNQEPLLNIVGKRRLY